jgi:hypothetical protein
MRCKLFVGHQWRRRPIGTGYAFVEFGTWICRILYAYSGVLSKAFKRVVPLGVVELRKKST